MATSIIPATTSQVVSATATGTAATAGERRPASTTTRIAGNFQTFLTLLTTQLKNQNPLDPLDTNQFTQQLVQFAQVEQQLKPNDQLATLVSLQKTAQSPPRWTSSARPSASTARPRRSRAAGPHGALSVPKPATATINIESSTGQTVYTGGYTMNAGTAAVRLGRQGRQRPAMARRQLHDLGHRQDASGQPVAIADRDRGARSTPSTSPRTRRCCRSPARTTRSTRSSAWSAIRTDRAVTLRSFLAAGRCTGGFRPDLLGNRRVAAILRSRCSRQNWRQFLPNCLSCLAKF